MQRGKGRALLDGELVERYVMLRHAERIFELLPPGFGGLARARIDEIEGVAVERRAGHVHCGARFGHCMQPTESVQIRVIQRLDAERDAIDAGSPIAAKAVRFYARRIGLERDLCSRLHGPVACDGIENGRHRRRRHQRRRAAAEEDARYTASRRESSHVRQLPAERGQIARLVDAAAAHVTVEVAIGALGGAERPMHINAEFFTAVSHRHRSRLR